MHVFGDPDPFGGANFLNDIGPVHSTPAPPPPPALAPATPSLTEEQRRRIEMNKQRALEKRLARQQQQMGKRPQLFNLKLATNLLTIVMVT